MHNNVNRLSILLADDDEDDSLLFLRTIEEVDANITCELFEDGEAILEHLFDQNNPVPDYIFLDLHMPKINGRQCLKKLKADNRLMHIPVIIYTTSIEQRDSIELMEMGAAHFVTKPTNPEEIYFLISLILEENWT